MEADQVQPRPRHRHRRGQPLHELQRVHDQVRGSVAPRRYELELHLSCRLELHPIVGQRRPGDVAAQLLQPLAVDCLRPHRGVQSEAVDGGTQGLACRGLARHRARKVSIFCPARQAEGNAASDRCSLQRPQGARLLANYTPPPASALPSEMPGSCRSPTTAVHGRDEPKRS